MVAHLIQRAFQLCPEERHQVAYIVWALGRFGDAKAVQPVKKLREKYNEQELKDEWDFAVIGQCNFALSLLTNASSQTDIK